ncbi:SPOR domain-containing protein [Sphingomonas jaspsi]|uniref:SPOR domain-containing protein n=1 Tax=Sphingomonas jaspsi TaxID=392409 RepID=UPI0004BB60EA|nr:SPOR domain-containing protein [Sphingomonas jaspsi]
MLHMPKLRRGLIAVSLGLSVAVAMPAVAAQESASAAMSRNIRILATDARNFDALIGAGRAALDMGDVQSAAGFFGRAQEVRPQDWRAIAGVGAAMAQTGDAAGAVRQFNEAQRLGGPVASFAIDRGLARDLLGDNANAQADYRLALGGPDDDEARRRLALSLAISKKKREALETIQPLLNRRDPGAQRSRAFVLALAGDRSGAADAIEAVMPGTSSQFERFFRYLPNLTAAEKAAAVHLGLFPDDAATRVAVADTPEPMAEPARPVAVASRSVTPPLKSTSSKPAVTKPAPTRPAPEPSATERRRVLARSDLGTSVKMTLDQEARDKAVRNVLADRKSAAPPQQPVVPAPAPGFSLPSASSEPAPAPEPEPLVIVDTTPPAPVDATAAPSVTELPKGVEGPTLPAEEVRLSGIDRLLATIAEPPSPPKPKVDDRAAKAAAAKKAADKKAADAKAAADRKEKEEAAKLGVAGTNWVQLAGGSNRSFMASEYKKLSAKSSLLKRRDGYVSAGKDYFRLLVGPFDSKADAQAFVNKLAKDGVDGFSWTRTPAQIKIEKLP